MVISRASDSASWMQWIVRRLIARRTIYWPLPLASAMYCEPPNRPSPIRIPGVLHAMPERPISAVIEPRRIDGGAEQDVHTPWRKLLCYTQRAGVTAKIKRATRRRERREGKRSITGGYEDR